MFREVATNSELAAQGFNNHSGRAVYRIFAKGGQTWSMSKRGGARLFVAA